jgi:hypothetical protein
MAQRLLVDGLIFCLIQGVLIMGSLYYNPRIWLHDYPEEIRRLAPPLTAAEKRHRWFFGVPIFLAMLLVPLLSTLQLRADLGGSIPFLTAYAHAFLMANIFNLFDALVIDLLILALLQPRFALIPEIIGRADHLRDWNQHFHNYLKGIVFCAVFSLPIALAALL